MKEDGLVAWNICMRWNAKDRKTILINITENIKKAVKSMKTKMCGIDGIPM